MRQISFLYIFLILFFAFLILFLYFSYTFLRFSYTFLILFLYFSFLRKQKKRKRKGKEKEKKRKRKDKKSRRKDQEKKSAAPPCCVWVVSLFNGMGAAATVNIYLGLKSIAHYALARIQKRRSKRGTPKSTLWLL